MAGKSAKRVFAGMTRPSTTCFADGKDVDARDKPGHDEERKVILKWKV
jgi:penicillin-binding protein 1C